MFKRTRLISLAAIAALLLSGSASAMAAASDHPKKKTMTHASKPVPKSASKRTVPGSAPAQYPSGAPY
jgi:hypothetical protein